MRLTERVVVGGMRAIVTLGDAQIDQQLRELLTAHGRAIIGVQGKLVRQNSLLKRSSGDKLPRQVAALCLGNHPTNDIATVDVEHGVEWVVLPLVRPA